MTKYEASATDFPDWSNAKRVSAGGRWPTPRLDHLRRLTGPFGLFEHARFDNPRIGHGYTVDDNARALVVLSRLDSQESLTALKVYRRLVLAAITPRGWHNRLDHAGRWSDRVGPDDTQGRVLWGLAHLVPDDEVALEALANWVTLDSSHPRSNAYALLGLCEVHRRCPDWPDLEVALSHFSSRIPRPRPAGRWRWPEPRLTYANARIPQALIEGGMAIADSAMVEDGLSLLQWLVDTERGHHGFSFTPVNGRSPGFRKPRFDQQPVEAWAMADACHSGMMVDGSFSAPFDDAVGWFLGRNDTGAMLYDLDSGAGFDGLSQGGVNQNRGAESTLAALGTLAAGILARDGVS